MTVNLLAIRTEIYKYLKEFDSNIYYEFTPDTPSNYIVFDIEGTSSIFTLEIHIYRYTTSTIEIETITDAIYNAFESSIFKNDKVAFVLNFNARNNFKYEDPKIRHRRLLFDLTIF